MSRRVSLCLEFRGEVPPPLRARMSYAFRVFAAIYGHEVLDRDQSGAALRCVYGGLAEKDNSRVVHIPARYALRPPREPAPAPVRCSYAREEICLFHGRDQISGNPDWLGEIFEWLSCADEMSIRGRDAVGRAPYEQTVFAQHAISPLRPHASLIMAWFQSFISGQKEAENLPAAPSPVANAAHLVIASHDIDFYFAGRWGSLIRVLKNLAIAAGVSRSYSFFKDSWRQLFRLMRGARVGDFVPELLRRTQADGSSSTFFVLAQRGHRRDANYNLSQIAPQLCQVAKAGCSIALHGSYRSVVENSDLESEAVALEAKTGERPRGSRQHWLRFDRPEKLFASVEQASFEYDSSWGWASHLGFRNGAAFAFPPYNFAREEAHNFLVIPLAIMDQGLQAARRGSAAEPAKLAQTVLEQSRRWGWGGVSVLWHNPIEPLSVCDDVNQIFWQQMRARAERRERWISAEEFLDISLGRYQSAGLLKGLHSELKPLEVETVAPTLQPDPVPMGGKVE
jgi:hypothetical protein